jgi:phosphohistidine phosphatase
MQLVLLRHGIAVSHDDPECPADDLRPLTPKGIARTRESAQGLKTLGVAPALVYTSPLVRARETALIAADVFGFDPAAIRVTEALRWEADPEAILNELAGADAAQVLCVGHAPNLDAVLAATLNPRFHPFTSLGKAGAASVTIGRGAAVLDWILTPRALRRLGA